MKIKMLLTTSLLCGCFFSSATAQSNKVVVVPLAGDDTSQQFLQVSETTFSDDEGCTTGYYTAPENKMVQVKATASASIKLLELEDYWYARPMFSVGFGSYSAFTGNQHVIVGGAAGTWSQSTNTKFLELTPGSTYSFRVDYNVAPEHVSSNCNLSLEFSYVTEDVVDPFLFIILDQEEMGKGVDGEEQNDSPEIVPGQVNQ